MPDFNKNWRPSHATMAPTQLADRARELRVSLQFQDPGLVAARSGASYLGLGPGRGELHIPLWGKACILSWPELTGWDHKDDLLPDLQQTLLLYYLLIADHTPLTGNWVSFADLPDGRMYNTAFQGYSGDEDFSSSCKILFDETACHYLPIDACAVLGGMLARKLIAIRRNDS